MTRLNFDAPDDDSIPIGRCVAGGFGQRRGCGGGRGRRGPRLLDPGMLRYLVLKHIAQQPRHGYDLIKLLQKQTGGLYTPSPGMIYPMLTLLEDLGHVTVEAEGNKKLYAITEQGRMFLQQNQALVAAIEAQIETRLDAATQHLRDRLMVLRDAVLDRVRAQTLTPEQIRQIETVLDRTIAEIQAL